MTMPLVALREKAPNRERCFRLNPSVQARLGKRRNSGVCGEHQHQHTGGSSWLAAAAEVFAEPEEGVAEMRFAELFPSQRRGRG